jgi:hypothetical protein
VQQAALGARKALSRLFRDAVAVAAATWLATELAEDGDTLFGLADLGFGWPALNGRGTLAGMRCQRASLPGFFHARWGMGGVVAGDRRQPDRARRKHGAAAFGLPGSSASRFEPARVGERVEGVIARRVDLESGPHALVERSCDFTLVPWRDVLERNIGNGNGSARAKLRMAGPADRGRPNQKL